MEMICTWRSVWSVRSLLSASTSSLGFISIHSSAYSYTSFSMSSYQSSSTHTKLSRYAVKIMRPWESAYSSICKSSLSTTKSEHLQNVLLADPPVAQGHDYLKVHSGCIIPKTNICNSSYLIGVWPNANFKVSIWWCNGTMDQGRTTPFSAINNKFSIFRL